MSSGAGAAEMEYNDSHSALLASMSEMISLVFSMCRFWIQGLTFVLTASSNISLILVGEPVALPLT